MRGRRMLSTRPSTSSPYRATLRRRAISRRCSLVQLIFECPQTGELLTASRRFMRWNEEADLLVSMHCPKCSNEHVFRRSDALLALPAG